MDKYTMICYIECEQQQLQVFCRKWQKLDDVLRDLDMVMAMFDIEDTNDIIVCGSRMRFRIGLHYEPKPVLVYYTKHFAISLDPKYNYVIENDHSLLVFTEEELREHLL